MRTINKILIVLLALLVIGVSTMYYISLQLDKNSQLNIDENGLSFVVEEGERVNAHILPLLEEKGVIESQFFAKAYLKIKGLSNDYDSINAGEYTFEKGTTLEELLTTLSTQVEVPNYVVLQFLEGYTLDDYAEKLAELFGDPELKDDIIAYWDSPEYVQHAIEKFSIVDESVLNPEIYHPLEGYIKPDTYHFDEESFDFAYLEYITDHIIGYRKKDFDDVLTTSSYNEYLTNPHQVLTLASIVEREAKGYEARQMVAGIFINRLKNGDRLGSDVTTYYGIGVDLHERDLTSSDLNTVNAYNTRNNVYGLPVGPINNPSRESITATLNYTESDYYFFVSDKNGDMYYTKTFEEHTAIIRQLKADGLWFEY